MPRFLSIGVLLLSIAVALLANFLPGPRNGVRQLPGEAVPLWRVHEMHWLVRFLVGYVLGLAPLDTMTACPTAVDWSKEAEAEAARRCMERGRSLQQLDDLIPLKSFFNEEILRIDRPRGGDPLRVTLLKRRNSPSEGTAPLILYIHGGGFTTRAAQRGTSARMFAALLGMDREGSPPMGGATWATVEYRLAPEHAYGAASEDCLLALNHLVRGMGLGGGGIHVAGMSAGGTLAMETTLTAMELVDTFYVDVPMIPLPTNGDCNEWSMDSPSFRRYAYTRTPSAVWLEWCLMAYTGTVTAPDDTKDLIVGTLSTGVDITGGSMTVSEWIKRSESTSLPRLLLVTSKGDPLQSGGLAFKEVYEQVLKEAAGEKSELDIRVKGETPGIKHFDTTSGHCGFYILEPSVFRNIMSEWYREISSVWERKVVG